MIFELMSRGDIARLPGEMAVDGLDLDASHKVILLLPYNRYLLGAAVMKNYERWTLEKWGADESEEIFLYEGKPKTLVLGDVDTITLSEEVVSQLKSCLYKQMLPPGEHLPAALILRGIFGEDHFLIDGDFYMNEEWVLEALERDPVTRAAYWAVRLALFRNDYDSVSRVKTWMKSASDVFDDASQPPRIWFSLTDLPGKEQMDEMEGLSFTLDDLQRMSYQATRPVVLYGKTGYLLLSDYGGEGPASAFRIWLYMPVACWNEMRERRKLSIREVVMATWGYIDGLEAEKERLRYCRQGAAESSKMP